MDDIYKLYSKNASLKVQIKQYFDEYLKAISDAECFLSAKKDEKDLMSLMGVELDEEEITMLRNYCSVDNLTVDGETPKLPNTRRMRRKEVFDPQEPAHVDLQTLKNLRRRLKQKAKRVSYKYLSEYFINFEKKETHGELAMPGKDTLIILRIYNPFVQRTRSVPKVECGRLLKLSNVTAVLGSQTLADLRNKISCIADYTISKECSENLSKAVGPMAKDIYKSGFFFIEDTFYNDMRCPSNIDYSKVIIEWASRRPKLGPFKTDRMENCRIDSLYLRFGFPWVYKHQGGCEHVIVFSDARLINCDDELAVSEYPRILRIRPTPHKLCMMCGTYSAQWITMEHEGVPHNPSFFCDSCFKSYNYVGKKKVGKFLAYAYPRNIEAVQGKIDI